MACNITCNQSNHTDSSVVLDVAYWEQIITAVLIGLIAIAGLIGNSMIILAVTFSQKLQTATNAFVTSLAIADLLTSFFLIWYTIGALGKGEWPIPQVYWICELTAFMIYSCIGTSMYNLAAIAVNRLIRITKPIWYWNIFTSWKLAIFIAIPWILPTGSVIIVLVTGSTVFGYDRQTRICAGQLEETAEWLAIAQVFGALFVPSIAIVVSYIWIYIYVKRHFRAQKKNLPNVSNNSNFTISEDTGDSAISEVTVESPSYSGT